MKTVVNWQNGLIIATDWQIITTFFQHIVRCVSDWMFGILSKGYNLFRT